MSRIYDNWEKLVGAVLRREKDRQTALFQSFSSSSSRSSFDFSVVDAVDFNSRFSFDSAVEDDDFCFNHFARRPPGRYELLPWATRVKVALGVARALAFLHDLETPVIHGNLNSAKILLDRDFNAKLWDFSLARDEFSIAIQGPFGVITHASTKRVGTSGYSAPEFKAKGESSTQCDVYSFGIVFLELISGLRVIDNARPEGKSNLMDWAKPYLGVRKRLSRIVDSRLQSQYPLKEAYRVAKICFLCVSSDPRLRPRMAEVVAAIEKLQ